VAFAGDDPPDVPVDVTGDCDFGFILAATALPTTLLMLSIPDKKSE
jgi:hypothetical protein